MNCRRIYNAFLRRVKKTIRLFTEKGQDEYVSVSPKDAERAYQRLNAFSPNPATSSITVNHICQEVDVQIVIPAYNAEKYICECIDSIIVPPKNISYRLIVINDGSKDNTSELLKKYADNPDVKIIDQSNKGHAGARNAGLRTIYSKYLAFVDSDDWVDWNCLEKMVLLAEETGADMIEGGFVYTDEFGAPFKRYKARPNAFTGFPCGKVFKADCFADICFPENYWFEDSIITQIIFEKAINKKTFPGYVYYYRQHSSNTTSTSKGKKKAIDSLYVTLQLHKDREVLGYSSTSMYYDYILHMTYLTFHRIATCDETIIRNVFVVFCDMINSQFSEYGTKTTKLKPLEKYIRAGNYGKWKAYCMKL